MSGYMGHHAFVGLGLSHVVPNTDCLVIVGIYTGLENHVITAIMSQASLKAQIVKLFGGIVSIIILEKNIEYTRTAAGIISSKKLGIPYAPDIKKITKPVYSSCVDSFVFEWIMQSPIPILVTDALPVRKGGRSLSEDSDDIFEVYFDPNYSEYDLMANRQWKETQYSQELKLATSPVSNVFVPYHYHMESHKTLINYAQTHPKANEYLKEVMKDSIAKMVRFTTESGMVECAPVGDTESNTSTIKHRWPLVIGVPLKIVSSHQGT
jgi:hypothetical protein